MSDDHIHSTDDSHESQVDKDIKNEEISGSTSTDSSDNNNDNNDTTIIPIFDYSWINNNYQNESINSGSWLSRDEEERNTLVINLKNKINKDFTPHNMKIFDCPFYTDYHKRSIWANVIFPSNIDKGVFFNCLIKTSQFYLLDNIKDYVMKQAWNLLASDTNESTETQPLEISDTGDCPLEEAIQAFTKFKHDPNKVYPQLSNKPLKQYINDEIDFILENKKEELIVKEFFKLTKNYHYGVGLEIVIDAPYLDIKHINHAIFRFRDNYENNWLSEKEVNPNKLFYTRDWLHKHHFLLKDYHDFIRSVDFASKF